MCITSSCTHYIGHFRLKSCYVFQGFGFKRNDPTILILWVFLWNLKRFQVVLLVLLSNEFDFFYISMLLYGRTILFLRKHILAIKIKPLFQGGSNFRFTKQKIFQVVLLVLLSKEFDFFYISMLLYGRTILFLRKHILLTPPLGKEHGTNKYDFCGILTLLYFN